LHLCLWVTKKFCKALDGAAIGFLITQNRQNEEAMGLEVERGLKSGPIFSKNLKQTIISPLPVFSVLLLYF
jgi:hypothetical protein